MITILKLVDETNASSLVISARYLNDTPVLDELTTPAHPTPPAFGNTSLDDILAAIINQGPSSDENDAEHFGVDDSLHEYAELAMLLLITHIITVNLLAVVTLVYGLFWKRRFSTIRSMVQSTARPALLLPESTGAFSRKSSQYLAQPLKMNYKTYPYLLSLATSDLLIGLLVAPLQLDLYSNKGTWHYGYYWCDFWRAMDVFFCTSSALHTAAIAADRWWTVSRTKGSTLPVNQFQSTLLGFLWMLSVMVSFPVTYLYQIESPDQLNRANRDRKTCEPIKDPTYIILSTSVSFFIPLALTVVFYVQTISFFRAHWTVLKRETTIYMTALLTNALLDEGDERSSGLRRHATLHPVAPAKNAFHSSFTVAISKVFDSLPEGAQRKVTEKQVVGAIKNLTSVKQSRNLIKAMTVVMVCYVICWTPYFLMIMVDSFCGCSEQDGSQPEEPCGCFDHDLRHTLTNIFIWLGYANSACNPLIYYCTLRDYRMLSRHLVSALWGNVRDCVDWSRCRRQRRVPAETKTTVVPLVQAAARDAKRVFQGAAEQRPVLPKRSHSFINAKSVLDSGEMFRDMKQLAPGGDAVVLHSILSDAKNRCVKAKKRVLLPDGDAQLPLSGEGQTSVEQQSSDADNEQSRTANSPSLGSPDLIAGQLRRLRTRRSRTRRLGRRPRLQPKRLRRRCECRQWRPASLADAVFTVYLYYDEWQRPINAMATEETL